MTFARRSPRLLAGTLPVLAALLLAACGSSASPSPAAPSAALTPAAAATSGAAATPGATPSPTPSPTLGPTPSPTSEPTAAAQPTPAPTASVSTASVTIKLAKGWQKVELTEAALNAQIKALQGSNPQLAAVMKQLLATGGLKNMKFYALGFSGLTTIGNVNVIALSFGGVALDAVQPVLEGEFKQLGATGIKFHDATVAGVTSLIVDYKITLKTAAGSAVMTSRVFLVPHGDQVYDATFTCYGSSPSTCLSAADKMANSMRVTP